MQYIVHCSAIDFLNVPDKFTSYYYFITRHLAGGFRPVVPELFNHDVEGVNIFFDRLVDSEKEGKKLPFKPNYKMAEYRGGVK